MRGSHMLVVVLHPHPLSSSSSILEVLKKNGQVAIISSSAAQVRVPNASEYCTSKHAINRFAEFITIGNPKFFISYQYSMSVPHHFVEYSDIKVFLHCWVGRRDGIVLNGRQGRLPEWSIFPPRGTPVKSNEI